MATADADQQAARHAELRRQYDELVVRSAEGASRAEVELAHCRAELKLKTHEAERLALQCETALADARRDEVSADAWREKLEVLRSEYYTLQADTAQRGATLEAQNGALSEKLRQYERLEEELDAAVIAAGEAAAAGGGTPGSDAIAPLAMIRVPSAAERRVSSAWRSRGRRWRRRATPTRCSRASGRTAPRSRGSRRRSTRRAAGCGWATRRRV